MKYPSVIKKLEENNIDPLLLNVSFNMDCNVAGWYGDMEPLNHINIYRAEIELFIDEEFQEKIVVGEVICYYLDAYDYKDFALDLRDIADSKSGDFYSSVVAVTDNKGQILEDYFYQGILYIDRYYIDPAYRGKGIGQLVLPLIMNVAGKGAGVITVIPCPMEADGRRKIKKDDPRYKEMKKRLDSFYKRFGFKKINKEVWAKDTA